jgi:predicted Fe-Mo cluster-binding NifX family protein
MNLFWRVTFNSASYYYVVDFRNKQNLILTQTEIQKAFKESKGSGFSALGIDTLICDGISNMALKILNEAGIEVYKPSGGNILHNLELMLSKKLNSQKAMSIPSSQTCSTSCSTCSTACT